MVCSIKTNDATVKETCNSPSVIFSPLFRYLDMISKELEQLERTAEEQHLLRMDREERRQREYTRKKLNLRRKIEEVRDNI
jgi:hypothetical protein